MAGVRGETKTSRSLSLITERPGPLASIPLIAVLPQTYRMPRAAAITLDRSRWSAADPPLSTGLVCAAWIEMRITC
jgi:hypothetical protein